MLGWNGSKARSAPMRSGECGQSPMSLKNSISQSINQSINLPTSRWTYGHTQYDTNQTKGPSGQEGKENNQGKSKSITVGFKISITLSQSFSFFHSQGMINFWVSPPRRLQVEMAELTSVPISCLGSPSDPRRWSLAVGAIITSIIYSLTN